MRVALADRMGEIAPYLFLDLDRKKEQAKQRGMDVISLTIGDPDLPTPVEIIEAAREAVGDPSNHHYPDYAGSPAFRRSAVDWMKRRFSVELDAEKEVVALIGSKEGIAHLPFCLVNPGDVVLCPEPSYPVYATSAKLAGARIAWLPLLAENGFLPDLGSIPADVAKKAKLLWINYPNNPTAAVAPMSFLSSAVEFARRHELVLCVDAAYSEIAFDGRKIPSVLEIPGSREVAVEFHSMSKTYNMTGWRVGFMAGQPEVVGALAKLKSNIDSGVFQVVQLAAQAAMQLWPKHRDEVLGIYQSRRDVLCKGLQKAGYQLQIPQATFYVWMQVPGGDDVGFASKLIENTGVLVTPGSGFGQSGKGFVRFSLTVDENRLQEAVERIGRVGLEK